MFLAGSILFAVRPTVAVAAQVHLSRLPLVGTATTSTSAEMTGQR